MLVDASHPPLEENEWDGEKLQTYYDIVMVRLKKPVTFSATVRPVCLPSPTATIDFEVANYAF